MVVVYDGQSGIFDDLYYFSDRVFPILAFFFEGPIQHPSLCIDPVGLNVGSFRHAAARKVLQKLGPLDAVAAVNVNVLK